MLTIKSYFFFILMTLLLSGCHVLNYQKEPKIWNDCDYVTITGIEFIFNDLPDSQQLEGYRHIFVAESRVSYTLPYAPYRGMKGKLTDDIIERHYPVPSYLRSAFRCPLFGLRECDSLYDIEYENLFLSPKQKEERERKSKFVVRKAILENCEMVYISIDPLVADKKSIDLIGHAGITIINNDKNTK